MTTPPGQRPADQTADLVGVPADELAGMLDQALQDDVPALPPAFAKDGQPYCLEDLLCGLPPVAGEEGGDLEPALLLTEVTPPGHHPAASWVDTNDSPPPEDNSDSAADQDAAAADAPSPSLLDDLRQAAPDPSTEVVADLAAIPGDTSDPTTLALSSIVSALRAMADREEDSPVAENDNRDDPSEDEENGDALLLTDDYLAAPPEEAPPPAAADTDDATTRALETIVTTLQALADQDDDATPPSSAAEAEDEEDDGDALVLTDDFLVPETAESEAVAAMEPDGETLELTDDFLVPETAESEAVAAVSPATPPAGPPTGDPTLPPMLSALAAVNPDGETLELTDDLLAADPLPPEAPEGDAAAPVAEVAGTTAAAETPPEPAVPPADDLSTVDWRAVVDSVIAVHAAAGTMPTTAGDPTLPENQDALALLLSDPPPAADFAALDALYTCWPKTTSDSDSRALLAVAQNLSRNFGLPGKLPMASAKAWRMLSPSVFEGALAQRLADIGAFIANWQKTQRTFLILEFGEIELIEYLFEALHPGYHADALAGVMNFKVLSNRRMGLLRRIPIRVKKQISPLLPDNKQRAMMELAHVKALLERVAGETGFAPIAEAATKAQEEVEKMMKAVANIGVPPPPPGPGGLALGRIG